MGQILENVSFLIPVAVLTVYAYLRRDAIIDAFNNFRDGGPRTPMHPSPADDSALLRRRSRKTANWHLLAPRSFVPGAIQKQIEQDPGPCRL